jgi:hypothetical protein
MPTELESGKTYIVKVTVNDGITSETISSKAVTRGKCFGSKRPLIAIFADGYGVIACHIGYCTSVHG